MKVNTAEILLPEPPEGTELAGYSNRRPWKKIHSKLKANLAIFSFNENKEVAVISIDTLLIDDVFKDRISSSIKKDIELFIFATHTHNAPSLALSLPLLGEVKNSWYEEVIHLIADKISDMSSKEEKKCLLYQGSALEDLNINRRKESWLLNYGSLKKGKFKLSKSIAMARNPNGEIDKRIYYLAIEDEKGGLKAIIWSLAAHPAFYPSQNEVSADFPGMVRDYLKKHFSEEIVVLYIPGLAGSAIPKYKASIFPSFNLKSILFWLLPFNPIIPKVNKRNYQNYSKDIGDSLIKAYEKKALIVDEGKTFFSKDTINSVFQNTDGTSRAINIQCISFGSEYSIFGYSGEMICEWTTLLKNLATQEIIFSGYMAGDCLYIPTSNEIERGGYEVDGFQEPFSINGEFNKDISNIVIEATKKLLGNA